MSNTPPTRTRNRLLIIALVIYALGFIAIAPEKGDLDFIRIPAFSLLLLVLIQVIFPQFRFSKSANLIAIVLILGFPVAKTLLQP